MQTIKLKCEGYVTMFISSRLDKIVREVGTTPEEAENMFLKSLETQIKQKINEEREENARSNKTRVLS